MSDEKLGERLTHAQLFQEGGGMVFVPLDDAMFRRISEVWPVRSGSSPGAIMITTKTGGVLYFDPAKIMAIYRVPENEAQAALAHAAQQQQLQRAAAAGIRT